MGRRAFRGVWTMGCGCAAKPRFLLLTGASLIHGAKVESTPFAQSGPSFGLRPGFASTQPNWRDGRRHPPGKVAPTPAQLAGAGPSELAAGSRDKRAPSLRSGVFT